MQQNSSVPMTYAFRKLCILAVGRGEVCWFERQVKVNLWGSSLCAQGHHLWEKLTLLNLHSSIEGQHRGLSSLKSNPPVRERTQPWFREKPVSLFRFSSFLRRTSHLIALVSLHYTISDGTWDSGVVSPCIKMEQQPFLVSRAEPSTLLGTPC